MADNAQSREGIGTTILSNPGPTIGLLRCERWRANNLDAAVLLRRLLDAGHIHGGRRHDVVPFYAPEPFNGFDLAEERPVAAAADNMLAFPERGCR